MNIEDVKQIPIADYLHSLGYSPVVSSRVTVYGTNHRVKEEHEPSFKVNTDRNLVMILGAGSGGITSSHWQRNSIVQTACHTF